MSGRRGRSGERPTWTSGPHVTATRGAGWSSSRRLAGPRPVRRVHPDPAPLDVVDVRARPAGRQARYGQPGSTRRLLQAVRSWRGRFAAWLSR